jgi:micrococcal nuclease
MKFALLFAILFIATNIHPMPAFERFFSKYQSQKPKEWMGVVTRVSDGDTLWVKPTDAAAKAAQPIKIRLTGIDAPESCQSYGVQSRNALLRHFDEAPLGAGSKRREVRVQQLRADDYGRALSRVYIREHASGALSADVAALQVRSGMAWSYGFRRDPGPYIELEREARSKRRGLFADPAPIEPSEFRKRHGPCEYPQPKASAAPARSSSAQH